MKLIQRENGYWYIYFNRQDRKSLETKDKTEAQRLFTMEATLHREKKVGEIEKYSRFKLSEFFEEYIQGNNKLPKRYLYVDSDTIKNDKLAFNKFIDTCGDLMLRQVERNHVDDFKTNCLQLGLRQTYINILLRALRSAFSTALSVGYIKENPFSQKRGHPSVLFRLDETLPRFLDSDEISSLLNVISDPDFKLAIMIFLFTGIRRSELVRLKAQDIDRNNWIIIIHKTRYKEARMIPVHKELKPLLEEKLKTINIGPLFPRWGTPDTLSKLFMNYAKKAGINARLNDLRCTFGAYLRMSGEHLDIIQKLLGHADIKTTQRCLSHIYAKVDNKISAIDF